MLRSCGKVICTHTHIHSLSQTHTLMPGQIKLDSIPSSHNTFTGKLIRQTIKLSYWICWYWYQLLGANLRCLYISDYHNWRLILSLSLDGHKWTSAFLSVNVNILQVFCLFMQIVLLIYTKKARWLLSCPIWPVLKLTYFLRQIGH